MNWLEAAGYLGSGLVLVSFLMTSVVKLRIVNMIGSLISCIYALIIRSYPLAFMNFALILINLYFLWKARRVSDRHYAILPVKASDSILQYLLQLYKEDIYTSFPALSIDPDTVDTAFLLLCEESPAGVVLGNRAEDHLHILLDYSLPKYRDYSLGRFLHQALPREGIRHLLFNGPTEHHIKYLQKMGYEAQDDGSWRCQLTG